MRLTFSFGSGQLLTRRHSKALLQRVIYRPAFKLQKVARELVYPIRRCGSFTCLYSM